MKELIISWTHKSHSENRTIRSDRPGKVRIGRDPSTCDIVLPSVTDEALTVSKLHVEIYFDPKSEHFYLHNLKGKQNPPKVYGHPVGENPVSLNKDGTIYLGKKELRVTFKEIKKEPSKPLICPHCKTGYTYEEANQMNGRCQKDGFPLHGGSMYYPGER